MHQGRGKYETDTLVLVLVKIATVLIVVAAFGAIFLIDSLRYTDNQQTIVLGNVNFVPDTDAGLRIVVQETDSGQPIEGASVTVDLQTTDGVLSLFDGQTDINGSAPIRFRLPEDVEIGSEPTIIVQTKSRAGQDRVERQIALQDNVRILLSPDKPLYQPGQTIHMRALVLNSFDLTPAQGKIVKFLVEDSKGNKVYRQTVTTSEFGIVSTDFPLADRVNQGDYKLIASVTNQQSQQLEYAERTVEVRPYVLPKFGLNLTTERAFYLPGQRVEGQIQADYFYGKPVAEAEIRLTGVSYDVERTVAISLTGQTDLDGGYDFSFDLPDYFAGLELDNRQTQFHLELTVIDQADHPEQTSLSLPIATTPLIIEAVPESGLLKPGVENIIYLLTAYPDGRPAPSTMQISLNDYPLVETQTGPFGLTEFRFVPESAQPQRIQITAIDEIGLQSTQEIELSTEATFNSVLLRPDRAVYVVGDTMKLTALTSAEFGSLYLDVTKAGQTVSTQGAQVEAGKSEFLVDLSADMAGTLELHAYKIMPSGSIIRDTRLVVVDEPTDISIDINPDKASYLPGEAASLDITTSGSDGDGVATALGISIVDESVFALQRQDPGFAKLYFMLRAELLEPRYQLSGFAWPTEQTDSDPSYQEAQDDSAKATWAGFPATEFSLNADTAPQKQTEAAQTQRRYFSWVTHSSVSGMIAIPLIMAVVVAVSLWRAALFGRSLKRMGMVLGATVIGGFAFIGAMTTFLPYFDLEDILEELFGTEPFVATFLLTLAVATLGLIIYAWRQRDEAAKFILLLSGAFIGFLVVTILATDAGGRSEDELFITWAIVCLLIPLTFLMYGQGLWVQARRWAGGTLTGFGVLTTLPAMVIFFTMFGSSFTVGGVATQSDGMVLNSAEPMTMEAEAMLVDDLSQSATSNANEPPRLRQFFPETLYWNPELLTDERGQADLTLPMADSITTWRMSVMATSQDGRLGSTTHGLRVFQDFFVDVDLPLFLTQGDEISIPVGLFNYLDKAQEVRLEVEAEPWFELLGPSEQTLTLDPNDIEVVYFPIRVQQFGPQGFQVTAWGSSMSDAIRRRVNVQPNGQEIRQTNSNWLRESVELELDIPPTAVRGTPYVELKVYPGVLAQLVEGLEKILRLPYG